MTVVELPVQIRLTDLLAAIERLSPVEFGMVASKVQEIQLNANPQSDLLALAQRSLSPSKQRRLEHLATKLEAETIAVTERSELLTLTTEAEQLDAERAEALLILAQQRNISLGQLLRELNPHSVSVSVGQFASRATARW